MCSPPFPGRAEAAGKGWRCLGASSPRAEVAAETGMNKSDIFMQTGENSEDILFL